MDGFGEPDIAGLPLVLWILAALPDTCPTHVSGRGLGSPPAPSLSIDLGCVAR